MYRQMTTHKDRQGGKCDELTVSIPLNRWMDFAPSFIETLGLTSTKDRNDVNAIGYSVRDDVQLIEIQLMETGFATRILISYSLIPKTNKISLSYRRTTKYHNQCILQ